MKLTMTIGNTVFAVELQSDPTKVMIKKAIADQDYGLRLEQLRQNGAQGNTYNNCTFGHAFPIQIPVPMQQIRGTDEEAIQHVANQTGMEKEMIQRLWESLKQYWHDKNTS